MDGAVVELTPEDTHELRRAVLRAGTASDVVEFEGDAFATTFHLGVRVGGVPVAISTWIQRGYAGDPERSGFQLRGMATEPSHRGGGLGTRVVAAGVERCRERSAELVWARARTTALSFYEGLGFEGVGDVYVDEITGLPHRDVVRRLD